MLKGFMLSRATLAAAAFVMLVSLAPNAFAQDSATAAQSPTQTQQQQSATPATTQTAATQPAATPTGETVAAKPAAVPLYGEYRGVKLGMSAAEVRAKLGKPEEKSDVMDFYTFSD